MNDIAIRNILPSCSRCCKRPGVLVYQRAERRPSSVPGVSVCWHVSRHYLCQWCRAALTAGRRRRPPDPNHGPPWPPTTVAMFRTDRALIAEAQEREAVGRDQMGRTL